MLRFSFFFCNLGLGFLYWQKKQRFLKSTGEFAKGRWLVHSQLDSVPCGYHRLVRLRDDLFVTKFRVSVEEGNSNSAACWPHGR